ncbi:hypothetical protein ACTFIV_009032 [Dictyostelium citrinum]
MFNFNKYLSSGTRTYKRLSNNYNNISKIKINNTHNNNNKLLFTSPLSSNNNNNNKYNEIKFYSTTSHSSTPPPIPPTYGRSRVFFSQTFDNGNGSISNKILNIFGIVVVSSAALSLGMFFYDDGEQNDEYIFRILTYFPSTPPFSLLDRNGYIKKLVEEYKEGTISPAGLKVIAMIASTLDGNKYLLKYDMFDIVCEKLISKKETTLSNSDRDFYILYHLSFNAKKAVPQEIVQKTDKIHFYRYFGDNKKKLSELEEMKESFKINTKDVLVSLVIAPIYAFAIFSRRISPPLVLKSLRTSAYVSSMVMCGPLLKDYMNQNLFNTCESFKCHALKSQLPLLGYGFLLVKCSGYPFISWILPVFTTLLLTKSYEAYRYIPKVTEFLGKKNPQNNAFSVEKSL